MQTFFQHWPGLAFVLQPLLPKNTKKKIFCDLEPLFHSYTKQNYKASSAFEPFFRAYII